MAESAPDLSAAEKPTVWARDHKIVFTNSFSMRMGDNDIAIEFSTEQVIGGNPVHLSQVQLMMTPLSARVLSHILNAGLEELEKVIGKPITLSAKKIAELEKSIPGRNVQKPT